MYRSVGVMLMTDMCTAVTPCGDYYCFNGGECVEEDGSSVCQCEDPFYGEYCLHYPEREQPLDLVGEQRLRISSSVTVHVTLSPIYSLLLFEWRLWL